MDCPSFFFEVFVAPQKRLDLDLVSCKFGFSRSDLDGNKPAKGK